MFSEPDCTICQLPLDPLWSGGAASEARFTGLKRLLIPPPGRETCGACGGASHAACAAWLRADGASPCPPCLPPGVGVCVSVWNRSIIVPSTRGLRGRAVCKRRGCEGCELWAALWAWPLTLRPISKSIHEACMGQASGRVSTQAAGYYVAR